MNCRICFVFLLGNHFIMPSIHYTLTCQFCHPFKAKGLYSYLLSKQTMYNCSKYNKKKKSLPGLHPLDKWVFVGTLLILVYISQGKPLSHRRAGQGSQGKADLWWTPCGRQSVSLRETGSGDRKKKECWVFSKEFGPLNITTLWEGLELDSSNPGPET